MPAAPRKTSELEHTVAMCLAKHWQARIACGGCGRLVTWRAAELSRMPRALTLLALGKAAECTDCGHVGARITLAQDVVAAHEADIERLVAKESARPKWKPAG